MVHRAMTLSDGKLGPGGQGSGDIGFGMCHCFRHVHTPGQTGAYSRGQGASGAVGIGGRHPFAGQFQYLPGVCGKQQVKAGVISQVSAFEQDMGATQICQFQDRLVHVGPGGDGPAQEHRGFRQVRGDDVRQGIRVCFNAVTASS